MERGLRVLVDATRLVPGTMGTQVVVLESVLALACHPGVSLTVAMVARGHDEAAAETMRLAGVVVVEEGAAGRYLVGDHAADIIFRPCQVASVGDLGRLVGFRPKVVVSYLDSIAYNNPTYFGSASRWRAYRSANQACFAVADGIAFLSHDTRRLALASGLVPTSVSDVVYPGISLPCESRGSGALGFSVPSGEFMLFLGASYRHKGRVAALRIFEEATRLGWGGCLAVAGADPPWGGSGPEEERFLAERPELAGRVRRLGRVPAAGRERLYRRCVLVLYPTRAEGFGLVPFEAALRGVPCLSSRGGALAELLPADVPTLGGDYVQAARLALELATGGALADRTVRSLAARACELNWSAASDALVALFRRVLASPAPRLRSEMAGAVLASAGGRSGPGGSSWASVPQPAAVQFLRDHGAVVDTLLPRGSRRGALARAAIARSRTGPAER